MKKYVVENKKSMDEIESGICYNRQVSLQIENEYRNIYGISKTLEYEYRDYERQNTKVGDPKPSLLV